MAGPHSHRKKALVTGGAGFIGANLTSRLARDGWSVTIFDSLARVGVRQNLERLRALHGDRIRIEIGDVRDADAVLQQVAGADVVYHFAAQVAVTTSLVSPLDDFNVNLRGTINVLEAARRQSTPPCVIYSSTNKVYGDLADIPLELGGHGYHPRDEKLAAHGIGEQRSLDFHTPYGCSKGGADQYVADYARSYGIPATVLRMSCIYGPWQMGNEDQGWVAHFILRALMDQPITIYGDGHQVRDILYIDDAVDAYVAAFAAIGQVSGKAYNLGGGAANAVSLRNLIAFIEQQLGRPVRLEFDDWRAGDQRYFVTDARALRAALGLSSPIGWHEGVRRLIGWLRENVRAPQHEEAAQ